VDAPRLAKERAAAREAGGASLMPRRFRKQKIDPVVQTLPNFIQTVNSIRDSWDVAPEESLWFRGQRDAGQSLRPSVYRARYDEDELRYDFARRAVQFPLGWRPASDWEWYFLMQHYGVPTRLLDWSEGALLALHFSLRAHEGATDAAVWMLDPWWLNRETLRRTGLLRRVRTASERDYIQDYLPDPNDKKTAWILRYLPTTYTNARRPRLPAALQPPYIDRRIAAQLSAFTIHGSDKDSLETVARTSNDPHLIKIVVPKSRAASIRRDLVTAGVVETSVFADLEGLAREITSTYRAAQIPKESRRLRLPQRMDESTRLRRRQMSR